MKEIRKIKLSDSPSSKEVKKIKLEPLDKNKYDFYEEIFSKEPQTFLGHDKGK